ncbi:hypothetical protein JCM6882_000518 [Rhodosporidiobolus microsporus]
MVRLSLAALGVAALSALSAVKAAEAPDLGSSVTDSQCESYTKGEGIDKALCGPVYTAAGTLLTQSDSVTTNVDGILNTLNSALMASGDSNAVTDILKTATNGLVSNLAYGVAATLGSVGSTIYQAAPQCKCDLSGCLNRLQQARQATASGIDIAQASCAQARFYCAPFYDESDITQVAPGCADFEGTTGNNPEEKRMRRSVRFARE